MRRRIALLSLLLMCGYLAMLLSNEHQRGMILVSTHVVRAGDVTEVVTGQGKINPVVEVQISPEISGEIIELAVHEGQALNKGDLLLKIKPEFYIANRDAARARYDSALATYDMNQVLERQAAAELRRLKELFANALVSEDIFDQAKSNHEVARARVKSLFFQVEQAKADLARSVEDLAKSTIFSPLSGTVTRLNSHLGERVLGTVQNMGTVVMSIADLNLMKAVVQVTETDVVLIHKGQKAKLEVDAFPDKEFTGTVTEIAYSASKTAAGEQDHANSFEVVIEIQEKAAFRPGMWVTARIETQHRSQVPLVPLQSVTGRLPSETSPGRKPGLAIGSLQAQENNIAVRESAPSSEPGKLMEVVFVVKNQRAVMVPVKRGIGDDKYVEIIEGVKAGDEVVSGSYRAVNRLLTNGTLVKIVREESLQMANGLHRERVP